MKNSGIFKGIIAVVALVIMIIIFNKPIDTYAAQSGSANLEAQTDVALDDSHYIHIYANTYIEYAYDEGASGWITYGEVQSNGGTGSNTVNIDTLRLGNYGYGSSTYYEKYYFYGFDSWRAYTGYVYIYSSCDEWGNLSSWITYEET